MIWIENENGISLNSSYTRPELLSKKIGWPEHFLAGAVPCDFSPYNLRNGPLIAKKG